MQIPILLEPVANNGYRATCGPPLALTAEGATRDEAIRNLEELLRRRLENGAQIAVMDLPAPAVRHPLAEFAGMFKDDPDFEEVIEIMAENRRKMDADPTVP